MLLALMQMLKAVLKAVEKVPSLPRRASEVLSLAEYPCATLTFCKVAHERTSLERNISDLPPDWVSCKFDHLERYSLLACTINGHISGTLDHIVRYSFLVFKEM